MFGKDEFDDGWFDRFFSFFEKIWIVSIILSVITSLAGFALTVAIIYFLVKAAMAL